MLFCWQTYCIIFVIVIVHELLMCACIYYGDFIVYSKLIVYSFIIKMYLYLEFPFKIQYHCDELVVKIYYIVQENIANLKQNILCD